MPGNRLDRSLKNNVRLDGIINLYRDKNISGATAGLVYNLGVDHNELSNNPTDSDRFVETFRFNVKIYNLRANGETAVTNNLKVLLETSPKQSIHLTETIEKMVGYQIKKKHFTLEKF